MLSCLFWYLRLNARLSDIVTIKFVTSYISSTVENQYGLSFLILGSLLTLIWLCTFFKYLNLASSWRSLSLSSDESLPLDSDPLFRLRSELLFFDAALLLLDWSSELSSLESCLLARFLLSLNLSSSESGDLSRWLFLLESSLLLSSLRFACSSLLSLFDRLSSASRRVLNRTDRQIFSASCSYLNSTLS